MSETLSPKYKFVKDGVFYYSAAFPKSIAATIRLLELHFFAYSFGEHRGGEGKKGC